ncbi:biliverdin-producing heme oxygenase [Pseudomonas fuscovaginae UPB0736]|uniref:biliverdin-producing heme oxygenase n=1 Tax=Pseudomonas asplenii TaxID=53407 RepID=UPI000289112A|nr:MULTISPECIES: biliverdin-producing heme oxygenase [Pseudomonas]UUQ65845.1 biliverdin-producing heme oxygenase [Pseudomonas fuscovaginae UPB0736]UZE30933.1 biliverdin-producing heme oxygenase [Pseudomonas asplenii]
MQATAREVHVPPVLQDLRTGTAERHIALEKRLPFFSDSLDSKAFQRLMQAYYGFYRPLESALQDSSVFPADFELAPRLKVQTLRRDLHALGLSAEAIDNLPICPALPVIDSSAACLGVLYVLEGATLGGQILRREVAKRLGIEADSGAGFLHVYGDATGRRWRDFTEYLGSRPMETVERQAVVTAAQSTFGCFEHWLESREVLHAPAR